MLNREWRQIIWVGIKIDDGICTDVKTFVYEDNAIRWFKELTDALGGEAVCEKGDYIFNVDDFQMKDDDLYFFNSKEGGNVEIIVRSTETEC